MYYIIVVCSTLVFIIGCVIFLLIKSKELGKLKAELKELKFENTKNETAIKEIDKIRQRWAQHDTLNNDVIIDSLCKDSDSFHT